MARIRSIKPETRTDLTVASWPIPARYAWVLLWGYLDDSGRGIDDDRLLVADLFPLDRDVTERKLAAWKKLWTDGGQICRYDIAGTSYLHAIKWDSHQRINRPSKSRIPPCPTHGPSVNDSLSDSLNGSHKPREDSLSDSLPRAQARVPAEQGAGSREKEQGSSEQGTRAARDNGSSTGKNLLEQHQTLLGPLPAITATALAKHADAQLHDGATPEQILDALETWRSRPAAKPGLLPHLVADQRAAAQHDPNDIGDEARAWIERENAKRASAGAR